jgi:hypothetical protein
VIAASAAAAALVLATQASTAGAAVLVTPSGVNGARPGSSEVQVERALDVPLRIDYLYPDRSCGTATFRRPDGAKGYAMFFDTRLASLWFERGARTDRGVHIGSTVAALRAAYPKLRSRPDAYEPGARNLFYRRPRAPYWRLRFDVSAQGRVTSIAFGNRSVFYTEGCA